MERALNQLPAVDHAEVRAVVPDRLVIALTEHRPIFIVRAAEGSFLIGDSGVVLQSLAADDATTFGLPIVDDSRRQFAEQPTVGGHLDEITLAAVARLAALTPEAIDSQADRLLLTVDDTEGYVVSAVPAGWRAVFGHYTPTLRPVDLIDRQVQCLRSRLADRGGGYRRHLPRAARRRLRHIPAAHYADTSNLSNLRSRASGRCCALRPAPPCGDEQRLRLRLGDNPPVDREAVLVALDVGTSKVVALIGEVTRETGVTVIGKGSMHSSGLKKGVVVNIDQTVGSIRGAREAAERLSGYRIESAIVAVGGNHVESQNSRGAVAVSGARREVSREDIDRATEVARAVSIPSNREVLHVLPRGFVVDGQEGVKDPLGMSAIRLEVETHIVHASATAVQNLTKCVQRADIRIDELVCCVARRRWTRC